MNTLSSLIDRFRHENPIEHGLPISWTEDPWGQEAHPPLVSAEDLSEQASYDSSERGHFNEGYAQWYEQDPDRFETERLALEERGFRTDILRDGRVCFTKTPDADEIDRIALLCDWLYPLRPPSILVEGNCEVTDRIQKNEDGSLNVFTASKTWNPRMAAVTVLDYYEEIKEVLAEVNGTNQREAIPTADPIPEST